MLRVPVLKSGFSLFVIVLLNFYTISVFLFAVLDSHACLHTLPEKNILVLRGQTEIMIFIAVGHVSVITGVYIQVLMDLSKCRHCEGPCAIPGANDISLKY